LDSISSQNPIGILFGLLEVSLQLKQNKKNINFVWPPFIQTELSIFYKKHFLAREAARDGQT
jgi:hypothetical protein